MTSAETYDGEPPAMRDLGPFTSADQALRQFRAVTHGIPEQHAAPGALGELVLTEALLMAGVDVSSWEDVQRQEIVRTLPPESVQVIAGWLLRARLAGSAAG